MIISRITKNKNKNSSKVVENVENLFFLFRKKQLWANSAILLDLGHINQTLPILHSASTRSVLHASWHFNRKICKLTNQFLTCIHCRIESLGSCRVISYAINLREKAKTTIISTFCQVACVRNAFFNKFQNRIVQFGHQFTRNFVPNLALKVKRQTIAGR